MADKNIKKINTSKKSLLILMSVLLVFSILFHTTAVFAVTASPTKSLTTPEGTGIINNPLITPKVTPSASASVSPSPSPTATKEPEFLQDFTIPPLKETETPNENSNVNNIAKPDSAGATIGLVQVDNIEAKRPFMWSDLIKYLAYVFFALAIVAVLYGLASMAALIFFKKDITLAGMRKRKKDNKKKNKK